MFQISILESIIIGIITMICGIIIHIVVNLYGNENIQNNNIFSRNKQNYKFYFLLFIIGILIHFVVKYSEFNQWHCEKICTSEKCEILCKLPINNITELFITR